LKKEKNKKKKTDTIKRYENLYITSEFQLEFENKNKINYNEKDFKNKENLCVEKLSFEIPTISINKLK
jgi:hypothetical protein